MIMMPMFIIDVSTAQPTGLLGNANGLADDDMQTPDGVVIDVNSTARELFENFGQMCKLCECYSS